MRKLEGKRAIITGAASGIGKASALLFAREGAKVVVADIDSEGGEEVIKTIHEEGGDGFFRYCDVTSATDCQGTIQEAVERFGGIDILFNNAGIIHRADIVGTPEEAWDRTMDVNVKSVFLMCKYAIPVIGEAGGGSIIITSSAAGLAGFPKTAAYCASKAAVLNLARAMVHDHSHLNIRFNCICPGDVVTPMIQNEAKQLGISDEEFHAESESVRPLRRLATPEEIAEAALYLAGDHTTLMTGAHILVDGGSLA